jgi:hypothetical protein
MTLVTQGLILSLEISENQENTTIVRFMSSENTTPSPYFVFIPVGKFTLEICDVFRKAFLA